MSPTDGEQPYHQAEPLPNRRERRAPLPAEQPGSGGNLETDNLALVERMRVGDQRALATLYDRWAPLLYAVAFRFLRDANEAEDVVEATFWQAWRQADRYEPVRGTVSTWLSMMCHSRALERARAIRPLSAERLARLRTELERTDGRQDPSREAEWSEQRALIRSAIGELPLEQREAIELAFYGGLSQAEIAERTGHPLGTVKTRIRLAMRKLKARLAMLRERVP